MSKIKSPLLLGLVFTLILLWPLLAAPYFTHHDDVQLIRVYEMNKCIQDFQIPCRWVPDLGGLYGYPLFNYYGPLPYYVGELFYLLSHSLIFSAKVMFGLSFILSFVFMYLAGRRLWGGVGGLISGLFYVYAPYHSVDFYVRGAMGEMWAFIFFPAIFWAILKLKDSVSVKNSILLALFIAGLIVSHNLSAMIFLPIMAMFIAIVYLHERNSKFIKFSLFSVLLGLSLSAFYFIPAYFEKSLVHLETTIEGYFSYTEHFKGLRKLFLDYSWGYGASVREVPGGPKDGLSYQIGFVHVVGWVLSLIVGSLLWKKKRFLSVTIFFTTFIALVSIFMINPKSVSLWKLIPPLQYLQFPWRFLEIIIFGISLSAGSIVYLNLKGYLKRAVPVLLILALIFFNFRYFRPQKFVNITDADLTGKLWDSQIKRSIFDYLPIYAKLPPAELASKRYEVLSGNAKVNSLSEYSDKISFETTSIGFSTIRLSQYYFPNWKIMVDNAEVADNYKNDLGLMTFSVPSGQHKVVAQLFDTPLRTYSNWFTLAGIILTLILLIPLRKKYARE